MGRSFDGNSANYMATGSMTLGLNNLTEVSVAAWILLTTIAGGSPTHWIAKAATGYNTLVGRVVASTTRLSMDIENLTLSQFPSWSLTNGIRLNEWMRFLFAWKRNAINSTDAVLYLNGIAQDASFTASGYSAAFVLNEENHILYYGRYGGGVNGFVGGLAAVNIWNRQLTAQEAQDDFLNPMNVRGGIVCNANENLDVDQSVTAKHSTVTGAVPIVTGPTLTRIPSAASTFLNMVMG